jgi:hypothetical protein
MPDADQIESINAEQLVTATDRILLTGRPRRLARGSMPIIPAQQRAVDIEPTMLVRRAPQVRWQTWIVVVATVASLVGVTLTV